MKKWIFTAFVVAGLVLPVVASAGKDPTGRRAGQVRQRGGQNQELERNDQSRRPRRGRVRVQQGRPEEAQTQRGQVLVQVRRRRAGRRSEVESSRSTPTNDQRVDDYAVPRRGRLWCDGRHDRRRDRLDVERRLPGERLRAWHVSPTGRRSRPPTRPGRSRRRTSCSSTRTSRATTTSSTSSSARPDDAAPGGSKGPPGAPVTDCYLRTGAVALGGGPRAAPSRLSGMRGSEYAVSPCYPANTTFHRLHEMGARRPFVL